MIAGRMKYHLQVYIPVVTLNDFGEEITEYRSQAVVRAERVRETAMRTLEASEQFPDHSVEFSVRAAHDIRENYRVQQLGGNLYDVVAVVPNIDKGYNTLKCERVNE